MKWFKKREPLGYLILFLCTGYEKIPTIKCAFGKYEKQLIEWKYDDNYWFPVIYKRTIPIYKKGIKILEKKGY
ncbi:MAG: hypothetical protein H5T96_09705, partial [Tissierellales bacterium]|nr:hypothetical protein [Tissierellales bacterium]